MQVERQCYLCLKQVIEWFWWPSHPCPGQQPVCRECGNNHMTPEALAEFKEKYNWDDEHKGPKEL